MIRRLGRGGMGDIHLASHERLPGHFVVKVLSPDLVNDQDALVRFRQEAVVMANIRHPNVVQLVDFNFTLAGLPFLVMEYLPGKDLADILTTRPFLAATQVSSIVRQVACALDSAHKLGIVHRDLKPENVMVVPCEGQGDLVKVIDFGISKARRFNHVTSASMVMGTPEFMSPEQAQGRQEEVDARSDQFALAVISYLLLSGRTPWGATAPVEILHRVVNKEPMPLNHDGSWPSVEAVLFRAMAKAPHQRYPSTLAFWRALDRAMVSDALLPASSRGDGANIHGAGFPYPTMSGETSSVHGDVRDDSDGTDHQSRESVTVRPHILDSAGVESGGTGSDFDLFPTEQLRVPSLFAGAEEAPQLLEDGSDGSLDRSRTTSMPRARRKQRPRAGRHAWRAVVLLLVLFGGASVGLQDGATLRARVGGSWTALRTFAARAAERGISEGQRLFPRSTKVPGKSLRAYVSLYGEQ